MGYLKINSLLSCLLGLSLHLTAQFQLQYQCTPAIDSVLILRIDNTRLFGDTAAIFQHINQIVRGLHHEGYIAASVDSLVQADSLSMTAYLQVGRSYKWVSVNTTPTAANWLERSGFRPYSWKNKPFYYTAWLQMRENTLQTLENNGYPFAVIRLDSLSWQEESLSATIAVQPNKLMYFDSIHLDGDARISSKYLSQYLDIKKGSIYNQSIIKKVRVRLQELPFVQEKKAPTITFKGDKSIVNLYLGRKKASKFDFLIGVAPPTTTTATNLPNAPQKLLFTGLFNIDVSNQFGVGERIVVVFEQLRPQTQKLNLQFTYPYVFNLPIGIDAKFDLYRRDTSFLDVTYDVGFQYLFAGGNYLKVFYNKATSFLLSVDKTYLTTQRKLPPALDVSNTSFGLEVLQQRLDYRFNPRRGWSAFIRGSVGVKKIDKNNEIIAFINPAFPDFDYATLYDSLQLQSVQYNAVTRLEGYIPLLKRSVIKVALQGGGIFTSQPIYRNEQFRIGGNRLLRGFNEEAFFVSKYLINTAEYRLLLGQNAYMFVFGDIGFIASETDKIAVYDTPIGMGAGITFDTKIGVFSVSTAWGRTRQNSIDWRAAKIHFGYVNLF
ncbi:MAG: BamA/TamA family outer membrane protein [Saprospiraceae bacterium]|nr:BamA/TamA family outer membrane protein [Saprospiraceae bacterium]MBP7680003.1 BamA/TamA family outer membrane protein [Saprospiraceae bacterium]